jgi:hypothetical protein
MSFKEYIDGKLTEDMPQPLAEGIMIETSIAIAGVTEDQKDTLQTQLIQI